MNFDMFMGLLTIIQLMSDSEMTLTRLWVVGSCDLWALFRLLSSLLSTRNVLVLISGCRALLSRAVYSQCRFVMFPLKMLSAPPL